MATPAHPLIHTPRADDASRSARRALAFATAANTLGFSAHTTYMYYLAPIALRAAGIEGRDALIFSLVAVAMGAAVVPVGRLADRIPRRYVMRLGLAALALAYGGVLAPSLPTIVAGTLATGFGLALLFVSFQSYVADLLASSARTVAYGRAGALSVLASAGGPFLAAVVFRATDGDLVGLRVNAALFAVAGFVGVLLTLALPSVRMPERVERGRWHEAARAAGPVALVYLFMGAGYGMTAPYFTVFFLDSVGLANETWGYLLAAGTVAMALGALGAGALGARIDPKRVALLGMTGLFVASLVLAFPVGVALLALGFLGRSLFASTAAPGLSTVVMSRAAEGRRAEAQAYASLAWNAGWATGGAVGGASLALLGGATFPVGGALALVGVASGVWVLARR